MLINAGSVYLFAADIGDSFEDPRIFCGHSSFSGQRARLRCHRLQLCPQGKFDPGYGHWQQEDG